MFTLAADQVTVPAGGAATVDLSADTRVESADGAYTARVVASGGRTVVTTPVAVVKEVESYDLTVVNLGPDGEPAELAFTRILGLDSGFHDYLHHPDGRVTARVPAGRYHLESTVYTGEEGLALLVQPLVEVAVATTVELDARQAKPFAVDFERDGVEWATGLLSYLRSGPFSLRSTYYPGGRDLGHLTAAHFGPPVAEDEMRALFQGTWAVPDAAGEPTRSERVYNLAWAEYGRMMSGTSQHVEDARLAKVSADYRAAGAGRQGVLYPYVTPGGPELPVDEFYDPISDGFAFPLPLRRTELYNTDGGIRWSLEVDQLSASGELESGVFSETRAYRPGHRYEERWNGSVLGPAVSAGSATEHLCANIAERTGDTILVWLPVLTDAAGHRGCAGEAVSATRLFRDGELIGEFPYPASGLFEVPPEPGTYRLEADVDRSATSPLSSRVSAAWTFASRHVAGDEPAQLPLLAVRFTPSLDRQNRAPAGERFVVPVSVDEVGAVGRVGKPTVEASFDDGATWTPVTVKRLPDGTYTTTVRHPRSGGYVSLRAMASDDRGNAVEQTIIRAYQLK